MELALVIDLALFGLFTIFLVALSVDEARQEKKDGRDNRIEIGSEDYERAA